MKVLIMFSIGHPDNPYKGLLVRSLTSAGVEVKFPVSGRFFLWKSVRTWRPGIAHLQWQHGFFRGPTLLKSVIRSARFFAQLFALRLLGTPFVWTVHNIVSHEKRFARWELAMCRLLARSVNLLIVHCPAAAEEVAAAYRIKADRIRVVPHGHFQDAYPPALDQRTARERLGIDVEAKVFLFFGQIRPYKGVSSLLDAFRQFASKKARLIIAGQPKPESLGRELQAAVSRDPRVMTEFGFISDDLLMVNICASDLVVLPYKDSLTSGAAILAASYGRPILAPRLGCMRDFPADAGIFFNPDLPGGLKDALERSDAQPLKVMGQAAEAFIREAPWSLVADLTLNVYREATEGRGGRP